MSKITAIRTGRTQRKRVNMFLDGQFAFSLESSVVAQEKLHVGQELTCETIEALGQSDKIDRCYNAAIHYLSYRPRSTYEIRERLHRRGFDGNTAKAVIEKLMQQGLVDDIAFAQFWIDNRESFSPRSKKLTGLELRKKGIAADIIDQVVGGIDENESAYQAAVSKANRLPRSDYKLFRRRLTDFLKRRGFDYTLINHTVQQVWQELEEGG